MTEREMIARAWRDEEFRNSLPAEVRDALPDAPENGRELSDAELEQAAGGMGLVLVQVPKVYDFLGDDPFNGRHLLT